jgi:ubiquinone/menaquinone biosynthesis C-methylase UbiE
MPIQEKQAYFEGRNVPPRLIDLYFKRLCPVERVLDVGCGTGAFLRAGTERGVDVVGIDVDTGALESASVFGDVALVDLEAGTLPFDDASFDGLVVKDVLEHLLCPGPVVAELYRVLRPGGRAIVSVPMAKPQAVWQDYTHVRGFTEEAARTMLEDAGFDVLSVSPMGGVPGAGRLGLLDLLPKLLSFPILERFAVSHELVVTR